MTRLIFITFLLIVCGVSHLAAQTVMLQWDPDTTPVDGYTVLYGTASHTYTLSQDAGMATTATVTGLLPGTTYYFVVEARAGIYISGPSNEVTATIPAVGQPVLPAPWQTVDVGMPTLAGTVSYTNNVFAVTGAGIDIYGTSDQFRFVYQPISGNTSIVAFVSSIQNVGDPWTKAGVMIRQDLSPGSVQVMMLVSQGSGLDFEDRSMVNAATGAAPVVMGAAPLWVRLDRIGSLVSSYSSYDGVTWASEGTATIVMSDPVLVGFAVTSHTPTVTATAMFSQVAVSVPGTPTVIPMPSTIHIVP